MTSSKQAASLFVGRWQPLHEGHKKLIETVLKKKKPVVIAIRDTEISHKNPYTVEERWTMIQQALQKYGALVKIVVIPDIDEICYGRDVGYDIRKIELNSKMQAVSGTKTREKNPPMHPVVWLTGQRSAGKTTLANALRPLIGAVVLDGDEMRESISAAAGFSKKEREAHNLRVARLTAVLAKQSPVIVSVIAPFEKTRLQIDAILKPVWVHVRRSTIYLGRKDHPYEDPKNPHVVVDSDTHRPYENAAKVHAFLKTRTRKGSNRLPREKR